MGQGRVVEFTKTGKSVRHGTATAYTAHGCRCDECRAWKAAYARARREANPEGLREYSRRWWEANPEAGREYSRRWREANPEAAREYSRRRAAATREANAYSASVATRNGLPWTPEEDAFLMENPANLENALRMGRSVRAMSLRKNLLNKKIKASMNTEQ